MIVYAHDKHREEESMDIHRREMLGMIGAGLAVGWNHSTSFTHGQDAATPKQIRVGMIGLDTSHVSVFTKMLNRDNSQDPGFAGCRITAAFPAGNPKFPLSRDRLEGFTKELRGLDVQIVNSI